ncbi:MAG: alpha/beta hydrolase [bacterium]|nr:alpha/beta hydrolase [bacterium]
MLIVLSVVAASWLGLVVLLWLAQDALVFPGARHGVRPIQVAGVRHFTLQGAGGPFRVAESVPANPRAVLVFFVGNGEDLVSATWRAAGFARHGVAVVVPEYPGYGGSAGRPGVDALHECARVTALHAAALAGQHDVPLVAGGISLGTFCAAHVAAQSNAVASSSSAGTAAETAPVVARLFLAAPPSTLAAAARSRFWFVPVGLFLRHRFDSLAVADDVRCPALVVHGEQDRIVPLELGEQLAGALAGPTEFVRVPGVGHNDLPLLPDTALGQRIGRFLRGE